MANGNFDTSDLLSMQVKLRELGSTESVMRQYAYDPVVFRALRENQVARLSGLENKDKDNTVTVHWIEHAKSATDPKACTTTCDFTGERAGTYSETYTLDDCVEYIFQSDEDTFRTSYYSPEEELARQFLTADLELAKQANSKSITFLDANNAASNYLPGGWTNDSGDIVVPTADWNPSMYAKFKVMSVRNKMPNFTMISGLGLHDVYWEAMHKTDAELMNKLGTQRLPYFDLEDLDVAVADMPTFLVNNGTYAIAVKNRYNPGEIKDHGHDGRRSYSIPSQFVPGLYFDVNERKSCGADPDDVVTHYRCTMRLKHFTMPKSIRDNDNTGILKLKYPA